MLRTAHRRTLHTVIPDHVADSLRKLFNSNINNTNKKQEETRNEPSGTMNTQNFPVYILYTSITIVVFICIVYVYFLLFSGTIKLKVISHHIHHHHYTIAVIEL